VKSKMQTVSKVRLSCPYDAEGLMVELQAQAPAFDSISVGIRGNDLILNLEGVYWADLRGLFKDLQNEVEGVIAEVEAATTEKPA